MNVMTKPVRVALAGAEDLLDYGHTVADDFGAAVVHGLRQRKKAIPAKFFYDERGSQLFAEICGLDEYYPTRTEVGILRQRAGEIADLIGPSAHVVEFGSGTSEKIRVLLDALPRPVRYSPIDISREHLAASAAALAADYPDIDIAPICADFTRAIDLPAAPGMARMAFFPGSTIGNFSREGARGFLKLIAQELGVGARLLIGVDLRKDVDVLNAAYNDSRGVTAAFNLNLLARINRELGGTFDLDGFTHDAPYLTDEGRVEMHLVSRRAQTVEVRGEAFAFAEGEIIHTEDSHKYAVSEFHALAAKAGWLAERAWCDADNLFSVHILRVTRA